MSSIRTMAKNIGMLTFAQIITIFLGMLSVAFIARFIGDADFGKLGFAQSFAGILVIVADLGLSTMAIRELARNRQLAGKYVTNVTAIKLILSVLSMGLIVFIINLLGYPDYDKTVVYLIGISLIINSFSLFYRSIYRAFEQMEYEAYLNTIINFVKFALTLVVLYSGYGLIGVAYLYIFIETVNLLFSYLITVRKFTKPEHNVDLSVWKEIVLKAMPFGVTSIVGLAYLRIDIVILSLLKGDVHVGWYNASCTIVYTILFLPIIFGTASIPLMSRQFVTSKNALKATIDKYAKYAFIISIPIVIVFIVMAKEIILLIYGPQFINSVIALQILSLYLPLRFINYAVGNTLSCINKEPFRAFSALIAVLANILFNLLLIPSFSYVGASISTVLTEIVLFVSYYYFTRRLFYSVPLGKLFAKPILACVPVALIVMFVNLNAYLLVIICLIVFTASLLLIRTFDRTDLAILDDVVGHFLRTRGITK